MQPTRNRLDNNQCVIYGDTHSPAGVSRPVILQYDADEREEEWESQHFLQRRELLVFYVSARGLGRTDRVMCLGMSPHGVSSDQHGGVVRSIKIGRSTSYDQPPALCQKVRQYCMPR